MVDGANGAEALSPASHRTNDPGATPAPLPDSQGDKAADQGAEDALAAGPAAGTQDAQAKPSTVAAAGATNDGTRPANDNAGHVDLDTSISKQDVRQ